MEAFTIYLPEPGSAAAGTIRTGSGIVGQARPDALGRITIDYEGNLYGASNIATYADRVGQAAGRAAEHYPTVARMSVPAGDLWRIGYYDEREGQVVLDPGCADALAAWLGGVHLDPAQLASTAARYERRRAVREALASPDPKVRAGALIFARQQGTDLEGLR